MKKLTEKEVDSWACLFFSSSDNRAIALELYDQFSNKQKRQCVVEMLKRFIRKTIYFLNDNISLEHFDKPRLTFQTNVDHLVFEPYIYRVSLYFDNPMEPYCTGYDGCISFNLFDIIFTINECIFGQVDDHFHIQDIEMKVFGKNKKGFIVYGDTLLEYFAKTIRSKDKNLLSLNKPTLDESK